MTDEQIATTGREAHLVLENPAYQQAMANLKSQVIEQWKSCPIRDQEGQLLLLQLAKLADKFDGILRGMIEAGKYSQHRIDIDSERTDNVVRRWARKIAA